MTTDTIDDVFAAPQAVSGADLAFPGDVRHLMPEYDDIPDEFKRHNSKWAQWQAEWFFKGLEKMPEPKDGIDLTAAMRHLGSIQRSFSPKHEHKMAAVAWLASRWFDRP